MLLEHRLRDPDVDSILAWAEQTKRLEEYLEELEEEREKAKEEAEERRRRERLRTDPPGDEPPRAPEGGTS